MPWSTAQRWLARLSRPLRRAISLYALLLAAFTLLRLLRISGIPMLDLANTFAPFLYMPLVVTFPLAIMVTQPQPAPTERARKRLASPQKYAEPGELVYPPRWTVLLQLALIAIGLALFALPTLFKPLPPPTGETFSIVTFNVQGSNQQLTTAVDWLLEQAPDIIALQETALGYDSRLAGLYEAYAHEDHSEGSARVFSRFPILRRDILSIEEQPGRQVLRLLLDVQGREVALYALHLTLPLHPKVKQSAHEDIGPEALLRYDEARRNAQIRRLLDWLETETGDYVVAGDFNMSDASLIYDEIADKLNDAWRAAGHGAGRTWPLAEAIGLPRLIRPLLRIDYIWHSESLRPASAVVGPAIGSDHLPLRAEFERRL